MMQRRVVVSGIGVVSAAGVGADHFWRGLTGGATGIARSSAAVAASGAKVIAAVKEFSGASYLQNERHARVLNRSFELLVGAGALAAGDAGLGATPIVPARLGVIVGIGPIDQYTDDLVTAVRAATIDGVVDPAKFAETARSMYPLRRLRLLPNVGPAILAIEHNA